MSNCARCGSQTPRSRLCKACARDKRRQTPVGGTGDGGLDWFECVECDRVFAPSHGTDPCPDCGSFRHRAAEVPA